MTVTRHVRRSRSSRVFPFAALLLGAVGLIAGLGYSWFVNPVEYVDVEPDQLGDEEQRTYLILVSLGYASDGDLARAEQRLAAMGLDDDPGTALAKTADEAATLGLAETSVRALTNLALALGGEPELAMSFAGTLTGPLTLPPSPAAGTVFAPTIAPTPTETPTPVTPTPPTDGSITPSPTPSGNRYVVADQSAFCDTDLTPALLTVSVQDVNGEGVPGVEIVAQWEGGQERFFTGLKPEQGAGYADFVMAEGLTYAVQVVEDGDTESRVVSGVQTGPCTPEDSTEAYLSGYRLLFRQTR